MANAIHPSQACLEGQEDVFHQPRLHDGLVLKHDLVHNNSIDIVTSFLFRAVAKRAAIPTQHFGVTRDMGCCSTVNSLLSAGYGIRLIDCGLPQLSMHSVREMCSTKDINTTFWHFRAFFQHFTSIDEHLRVDV